MPQGESLWIVVDGFLQWRKVLQCAGAIDGSHNPILAPPKSPKGYFYRKGFHSILLQGVVDHQYRFIDVYIGWVESGHSDMPPKKEQHWPEVSVQLVAACCVLHTICEIHDNDFDESWQITNSNETTTSASISAQGQSSARAAAVRKGLVTYFDTH